MKYSLKKNKYNLLDAFAHYLNWATLKFEQTSIILYKHVINRP